jgi:hypothetical protein
MKKVEGYSNLYKDTNTGVIHNNASSERERYRIAKENSIRSLRSESEIEKLNHELSEIKSLLLKLTKDMS